MSAVQRGWIAVLCLVLSMPAAAQQRYQLAPLGFELGGTDPDERPTRQQWRATLSAMFPPLPGADHRTLQRDMLVDGHDRRRDVAGALDTHGLSEAPDAGSRWADLEWKPPRDGHQYLSIMPVSAAVPIEAVERMTARALNGGPCGPLPVVRIGRLLPTRPGMPTFAVECRGHAPTPGGGIAQTDGVAAVAMIADGLALSYAVHGPGAGARHIDRFAALVATMQPGAAGNRQALRADGHAQVIRRFGPAMSLATIEPEQWERAGPMNTRLCDAKWGEIPRAVTCLRIFPAGEAPGALLERLLLVDTWECGVKIVRRSADADQASAHVRCENAAKVGGVASRIYTIRRDPADGRLVFAATYGKAEDAVLLATSDKAGRAITEVLSRR